VKADRKISSDYYFWSIESFVWDPFIRKMQVYPEDIFFYLSLKLGMHVTKKKLFGIKIKL
jgi:hypothetical protein